MTTTTAPVTETTETTTTTAKPAKQAQPTEAQLRTSWETADKAEIQAKSIFDAAQIQWENTRVLKCRIAYQAAMLKPFDGGTNLLHATRVLATDVDATPAKRTSQAKSRKNTLRNYVDAGAALQESGLAYRVTEPDEEERKIVAAVFREGNRREKAEAKAAKATPAEETGEGVEGSTPTEEDALTFAALLAHVSRMNGTADMLIASGVPVSEDDLSLLARVLDDVQLKLAVYAG